MKDVIDIMPEQVIMKDTLEVPPPITFRTDRAGLYAVVDMYGHSCPAIDERVAKIAQRVVFESQIENPTIEWPLDNEAAIIKAKEILEVS